MDGREVILVFGDVGQLAKALADAGAPPGRRFVFAGPSVCDLLAADPGPLIKTLKPAAVINAAAYTAVDRAESEPALAWRLNCEAVRSMAHACAEGEVPFVHVSTDYVFDGEKPAPYLETDVRRPLSVYGASKAAAEEAVEAAGGRWTILRTSWVFSPMGVNFIRTMIRLASERSEVSVVADQWGRPTLAADLADVALRSVEAGLSGRTHLQGLFHVAGADDVVWADIAGYVFEREEQRTGKKTVLKRIKTPEYPTPAKRPMNSRLDTAKLQAAAGWSPRAWRDTVDACLAGAT